MTPATARRPASFAPMIGEAPATCDRDRDGQA